MFALIDSNGIVQNLIEWDGESSYTPPDGLVAFSAPEGTHIGATYANGVFTNPKQPDPAPTPVVVEPPPSPLKVLTDLLVAKNLVSQADITAAETEAGVTLNQTGAP